MKAKSITQIIKLVQTVSRKTGWAVPLNWVYKIRWLAGNEVLGLSTFSDNLNYAGKYIKDRYLSTLFANECFSTWALDVDTLNLLIKLVLKRKPKAILEFGAGVSTICFAYLMKELYPDATKPSVFSIEQDQEYLDSIRQRLVELGLEDMVRFCLVPVGEQIIEGMTAPCYQITSQVMENLLDGLSPDFILIDGPSGKKMARFGTLPLVKAHIANGAWFFLDDALRNEELRVASTWKKLSYLKIYGIYLIGKGLLTGMFRSR